MALADPQSVTINAVAISVPRTSSGVNSSVYTSADGSVRMTVSHAYGKRNRRTVRIEHAKIALDPLLAQNTRFSMTAYVVVDEPRDGYSLAERKQIVDALTGYLTAASGASTTKLLGGES